MVERFLLGLAAWHSECPPVCDAMCGTSKHRRTVVYLIEWRIPPSMGHYGFSFRCAGCTLSVQSLSHDSQIYTVTRLSTNRVINVTEHVMQRIREEARRHEETVRHTDRSRTGRADL
jgi:hypothetical protein